MMSHKIVKHMNSNEYRVIHVRKSAVIELFKDAVSWNLKNYFDLLMPKPWCFGWNEDADDCMIAVYENWLDNPNLHKLAETLSFTYTTDSLFYRPGYTTITREADGKTVLDKRKMSLRRHRSVKHLKENEYRVLYVSRKAVSEYVFHTILKRLELYFDVNRNSPCIMKWDNETGDFIAVVYKSRQDIINLEELMQLVPYTTNSFTLCEFPKKPKYKRVERLHDGHFVLLC